MKNFIWSFIEKAGDKIIGLLVSIFLTRLLEPEDFGKLGMVLIFMAIGRALADGGMPGSVLRKKEPTITDYSSVFQLNLIFSLLYYAIIFFLAPFIAQYYNEPELIRVIRLLSLTVIINSGSTVQRIWYLRTYRLKSISLIVLTASIIGGILGIVLALSGSGVYSLVYMYIATSVSLTMLIWIFSDWKPQFGLSRKIVQEHLGFGMNITLSSLLSVIFNNIYYVIIGKYFNSAMLGYYTRADTYRQTPINIISSALNQVAMPRLVEAQDDPIEFKRLYREIQIKLIVVVAPLMIGLAVTAKPLFILLFTEKWIQAVPFFQLLCVVGILSPIITYNLNVIFVMGKSDLYLKLELIKKAVLTLTIVLSFPFGIYGLMYGQIIYSFFALFINVFYSSKFMTYRLKEQFRDVFKPVLISSLMGFILVCQLKFIPISNHMIQLTMSILIGALSFWFLARVMKLQSFFALTESLFLVFKKSEKIKI